MEEKLCVSCEEPVIDKQPPCPLSCQSPKCKAFQRKVINVHQKPIVWILGGPGAGKSVQCERICKKYGYTHISTGDLVRAEAGSNSDRAKCLNNILARGGLVPTDIVLGVIKDVILKTLSTTTGYVIDGYPRDKGQGVAFEKTIASPSAILYLEATPETLLKRMMGLMGKSGRVDDTEETINKRIHTFLGHVPEILLQYGLKMHRINAEASADEVFAQVQNIMDPIATKAQTLATAAAPQ